MKQTGGTAWSQRMNQEKHSYFNNNIPDLGMGLAKSVVTDTGFPLNISLRKEDQLPFCEQSPTRP